MDLSTARDRPRALVCGAVLAAGPGEVHADATAKSWAPRRLAQSPRRRLFRRGEGGGGGVVCRGARRSPGGLLLECGGKSRRWDMRSQGFDLVDMRWAQLTFRPQGHSWRPSRHPFVCSSFLCAWGRVTDSHHQPVARLFIYPIQASAPAAVAVSGGEMQNFPFFRW